MCAALGGTTTRTADAGLRPAMAPPRASTTKLDRNLRASEQPLSATSDATEYADNVLSTGTCCWRWEERRTKETNKYSRCLSPREGTKGTCGWVEGRVNSVS
jgi:hypothetical protein